MTKYQDSRPGAPEDHDADASDNPKVLEGIYAELSAHREV